jgi:GH43 family beta-xylosidase
MKSKRHLTFLFFAIGLFAIELQLSAQNINNPVLPGVADAGVIKFNGKYYIGGVYTNGDFYTSTDLVNWTGPHHVIDMENEWTAGTGAGNNQIHANDMIYLNGTFHLYWSVNHWGRDKHIVHIAHAESDDILGPYHEPVKDQWMDNRIDPQVFKDDDGKLYMYMVRFTDGNTIWARPLKDPRTFGGHPVYLFASLPNTWETMDNRVAEGPWVMKYRNRYYMMYNANHTSTEWGNYQLGVAEADSPVSFNNGTKYPYPLLLSNQTILEEQYADILRFNETYTPGFRYTANQPQPNWTDLAYDDGLWQNGEHIVWDSPAVYLRKTFTIDPSRTGNLALRVNHNGDIRVYLNGKEIYNKAGADYVLYNLGEKDRSALKKGKNVLAVESRKGRRNTIDVSLFDMKEETAGDILFSPGQPNILRGPNGFEWWLIYMANKNKERRGQYISRIHFHNKTMHADGITSATSKGYFPEPAKATYSCTQAFAMEAGTQKLLTQEAPPATSYLFEAGVKTGSAAGVIAWWKDDRNWIKAGLKAPGDWFIQQCIDGQSSTNTYPLPGDFRFGVYHKITIERNVQDFSIRIDDMPAPHLPVLKTSITTKGIPGLFSEKGSNTFDGLLYTIGWDEFDRNITAWGHSASGDKQQGTSETGEEGITSSSSLFNAFKGDMLSQYEFSLQLTNHTGQGKTGAYPVYIDKNNYVLVHLDFDRQHLIIDRMEKGKITSSETLNLSGWKTQYADMKYTDGMEKGYTFNHPVWVDGIRLSRMAYGEKGKYIPDIFDRLSVEYKQDGKWHPAPISQIVTPDNPIYSEAVFGHPIKTGALRFINKDPEDQRRYIYKIRTKEKFKTSYNLRFVKRGNVLYIGVDGHPTTQMKISNTPSQVGIYSGNAVSSFNGITRYHIPE